SPARDHRTHSTWPRVGSLRICRLLSTNAVTVHLDFKFPRNGNAPVAISYKTTPKENKSVRAACVGDPRTFHGAGLPRWRQRCETELSSPLTRRGGRYFGRSWFCPNRSGLPARSCAFRE